jgi:type II secretory pathway component GspD/PulD (secretin)
MIAILAVVACTSGAAHSPPGALGIPSPKVFASGWRTPLPVRLAEATFSHPGLFQSDSLVQAETSLEDTLCSINAVDTELASIMAQVSSMTKANLVLLTGQKTKLTLRLSNVKLRELINHVCAMASLSFIRVGTTYVIATEAQLKAGYPSEWMSAHEGSTVVPDAEKTTTYLANYVNAAQLVETIKSMFGDTIKLATGASQLTPTIAYQATSGVTGIQAGVLTKDDSARGRMIVLWGPGSVVDAAVALMKQLDYARPQVAIKVTIHDISNEALKELGTSWTFGDLSITESTPSGFNFGTFSRSGLSFSAQLKALEKKDVAKLLASPNVSVLDGERAFILIGSRLSYPVLIGYSQANTPIYDKQEERVGIYLQVSASVADGDKITMNIYPQVSTVTGFLQVNGASYPQISTREAQTSLRVSSGETIVMGGLLRDEDVSQMEKVPLISEIPILGELFKRRKTTKVSSQVIITITPVVIKPKEDESR